MPINLVLFANERFYVLPVSSSCIMPCLRARVLSRSTPSRSCKRATTLAWVFLSIWPTTLMSYLEQLEADLVTVELDAWRCHQRPANTLIILQCDDHATYFLIWLSQFLDGIAHVP